MKTFEVSQNNYHSLRMRLSGWVFHRVDKAGRYLIRPFGKHAETAVRIMSIREITDLPE